MKNVCTLLTFLIFPFALHSQYCLPNGTTFHTQSEIDSFHVNYPECSIIGYDVLIQEQIGGNIKNLDSLYAITEIEGDLVISYNDSLQNLSGLDSLKSIDALTISYNNSLQSLSGLDSLNSVDALTISYNNVLSDLNALSGLTSLKGDCHITNNPSLTSLSGLNNITEISGTLYVMDNDSLADLSGLESLDYVNWHVHIGSTYPGGNPSVITNLSGLANLNSIGGELQVTNCSRLHDLSGLNNLHHPRALFIIGNDSLVSLTGLESVTNVYYGDIIIQSNPSLLDLTGLNNLDVVGENFTCSDNNSLESLNGLDNLNQIDGNLVLYNNAVLSDISALSGVYYTGEIIKIVENESLISLEGLDNIEPGSFSLLNLANNSSLCDCAVTSVCDYLDGVNVNTIIHDNAPGCNSQAEVEAACVAGVGQLDSWTLGKLGISLFPNPATLSITMKVTDDMDVKTAVLSINSVNGRELLSSQLSGTELLIDVSSFPEGVYFVRVVDDRMVQVGKFVKQ